MNISKLQALINKTQRRIPKEIVGIDFGAAGVKVARITMANGQPQLIAADILPAIKTVDESTGKPIVPQPMVLPAHVKARISALAISGTNSVIKLLSIPGHFDASAEARVVETLGLEKPENYRIGYKVITEGHGKSESRILSIAIPEAEAQIYPKLFPSGTPIPCSVEISELATLTAFTNQIIKNRENDNLALIDFGTTVTMFSVFAKGILVLLRRFQLGTNTLLEKVQTMLGVNMETARGIISDGAFDISHASAEVIGPFLKQLAVSRDYIERRENCKINAIYTIGGMAFSRDLISALKSTMAIEPILWNPVQAITTVQDAIPENIVGQEWRLTAAIGSALASFEAE